MSEGITRYHKCLAQLELSKINLSSTSGTLLIYIYLFWLIKKKKLIKHPIKEVMLPFLLESTIALKALPTQTTNYVKVNPQPIPDQGI